MLLDRNEELKFRTKRDIIRPTIHGEFLDFTYINLVNFLGINNSEYAIALKASNVAKLNILLVMSYVSDFSRVDYLQSFANESRLPNDKNVYLLFEKYAGRNNNTLKKDNVKYSNLSDRDLLMLLAERSLAQKEQIESLVKETKGIRRSIEKVVIRVLFAIKRVLAMFWADNYENGKATKENPTNPENSDATLQYNKRIDILGADELKVQKTKINTQRK